MAQRSGRTGHRSHIDLDRPNAARVYDYLLGGRPTSSTDREFAEKMLADHAGGRPAARLQPGVPAPGRAVLRRGRASGSSSTSAPASRPSATCTRSRSGWRPECRVVYVDNEPVAVAHSELMLRGQRHAPRSCRPTCATRTRSSSSEPVRRLIDFDEPVALLMVAVLHFVPDEAGPARRGRPLRRADGAGQLPRALPRHAIDGYDERAERHRRALRPEPRPRASPQPRGGRTAS